MKKHKQWHQLVSMLFIFLNKTTPCTQRQEDMEPEQCQTLTQTTIQNTSKMKLLSDPVLLTHIDIQVRFSEQETLMRNSQVKELSIARKW